MKIRTSTLRILGSILIVLTGCSREGDLKSSASRLKEEFPTATAAAPPAVESSAESVPKPVDNNASIGQAVSLLQNNDQVGAVTLLNAVQQQTNLTTKQRIAVYDTIEKVYANLVARADKGDPKAKAAMAELEKKLSQ